LYDNILYTIYMNHNIIYVWAIIIIITHAAAGHVEHRKYNGDETKQYAV